MFKNSLCRMLFSISLFCAGLSAEDSIVGFWKTVNETTHRPESVVAIYEYDHKYYGRLILTYDDNGSVEDTIYKPNKRAPGVKGDPFYAGLDIIWNLEKHDSKYVNGKIMDPEKGKVYRAKLWRENGNLIVRGELLVFGRNQTWPKMEEKDFPVGFKVPDLKTLTPDIHSVK